MSVQVATNIARRIERAHESFRVVETETRVAIKNRRRTIAYVQIGSEAHAAVLAAAPRLRDALALATDALEALTKDAAKAGLDRDVVFAFTQIIVESRAALAEAGDRPICHNADDELRGMER